MKSTKMVFLKQSGNILWSTGLCASKSMSFNLRLMQPENLKLGDVSIKIFIPVYY